MAYCGSVRAIILTSGHNGKDYAGLDECVDEICVRCIEGIEVNFVVGIIRTRKAFRNPNSCIN